MLVDTGAGSSSRAFGKGGEMPSSFRAPRRVHRTLFETTASDSVTGKREVGRNRRAGRLKLNRRRRGN